MRFLIDMPLTPALVGWLAEQGHDALHASDVGLGSGEDVDILGRARSEDRVLVTADLDFPRILALTAAEGPAVVLFRGGNFSNVEMLQMMARVLTSVSGDDLCRSVTVVEPFRVRWTVLPLRRPPRRTA